MEEPVSQKILVLADYAESLGLGDVADELRKRTVEAPVHPNPEVARALKEMEEIDAAMDVLLKFPRERRLAFADRLSDVQMRSNFCDDEDCESCNPSSGVGGDGHIY